MKIFSSLGVWAQAHKKIAALLGALGIAAVGAGIFFGWQEYERRQSAAFALEKLKESLAAQDTHELAILVDFKSLSDDMVKAAKKTFPFLAERNDPDRALSHSLQKALLHKFMQKEQKSQFPEDESEMARLKQPLALLPPDFAGQMTAKMACSQMDANHAELRMRLEHPQLKQEIPITLSMEKGRDGWIVRHFANAEEATAQLRQALLQRYAALRNVYLEKNAATTKEMNGIIPLQSCSAGAGMLSDHKTFMLIIRAKADNKSKIQVNNFNLDTTITGKSGKPILRRYLNAAKPVKPGEMFDHSWSVDLEGKPEIIQELLADSPLSCHASWQTLTLNNGKVLHIDQVPNPAQACLKQDHDHPAAFCELPLFSY